MRHFRRSILIFLLSALLLSLLVIPFKFANASTHHLVRKNVTHATMGKLSLDTRLPAQTFSANSSADNVNAAFGSRFAFVISPSTHSVASGTDGVYHDNSASYVVGIAPTGKKQTSIFHMGNLDSSQGDMYVLNEKWTQGLDTSRWEGDASDGSGLHIIVDIIDTFVGEPGCTAIANCSNPVKEDTVPVLLVGVTLENTGSQMLTGNFLFGSNRSIPGSNACVAHTTAGGNNVNVLSYSSSSDATGGTLFLAGQQPAWQCNTSVSDRAGLAWNYSVTASQSLTSYMILGGWNPSLHLFANTQLPAGCQNEGLYAAQEWSSENAVVDFAIDDLGNLLSRAQSTEDILIQNNVLTTAQRWVIADTLRSYKASSWLMGRQSCAGGGYDAAIYEGAFGFLTTVDVLHEYGYFEINRVPWFFRSELSIVFKNVTGDAYGTYFQHDQGGDVTSSGVCTSPGAGTPTIRATCYGLPRYSFGSPMPTEENSNVALLAAYYVYVTGDTSLLTDNNNLALIDAGMAHNQKVGDPATGMAYNFQDTNTTYDDQNDCLHNDAAHAGNLYYQGLKEATGYLATAYLDSQVSGDNNGSTWTSDANKIENAMLQEYKTNGFIPLAENTNAYNNCNGRSITLGEGLFYLHLIGQDKAMDPALLQDLASQYPQDLSSDTLTSPAMIALEFSAATGSQCPGGTCQRYEWFSKVMLSSLVADLVYTAHGCSACRHVDVMQTVYNYNVSLGQNYGDGIRSNGSIWPGTFYPRGLISWAFLNKAY